MFITFRLVGREGWRSFTWQSAGTMKLQARNYRRSIQRNQPHVVSLVRMRLYDFRYAILPSTEIMALSDLLIAFPSKKMPSASEKIGSPLKKMRSASKKIGSPPKKMRSASKKIGSSLKKMRSAREKIGSSQKKVVFLVFSVLRKASVASRPTLKGRNGQFRCHGPPWMEKER